MWNAFTNRVTRHLSPVTMHSMFVTLVSLVSLPSCEIDQKEILPEDGFTKIYNHPEETLSYHPESVVELSGGGYLFLSAVKDEEAETEYPSTSLIRTSSTGEVEWTMNYDWLAPSSKLIQKDGSVGFVAMNRQFEAHVILVDPANGNELSRHDLEMTMPLYAYADSRGDLVVLGYENVTRSSWICRYNSDFILQRSLRRIDRTVSIMVQMGVPNFNYDFWFQKKLTPEQKQLILDGFFIDMCPARPYEDHKYIIDDIVKTIIEKERLL